MMDIFVVYSNPKDAPGRFVVRKWYVRAGETLPGPITANAPTLERAVSLGVPPGLVRLPRNVNDDPVIVETWL